MRSLLFIEQFSSITPLNFYNQLQVTKDIVVKVTSAGNKIADARSSRGRNPHYQGLTRPHSTRAADSWRLSHGGFPGGNSCWKAAATRLPFFVNCQHERKKNPLPTAPANRPSRRAARAKEPRARIQIPRVASRTTRGKRTHSLGHIWPY